MRTTNLNLMMQKGSRVVQMIIAHKSFHIIYIFKRLEQNIKLRWQWNSVYYSFKAANNKSTDKTTICADRYEPRSEKTGLRGFRPGPIQTGLYNHRRWLEA